MRKNNNLQEETCTPKITSTPFNEYREEQSGIRLVDYFVKPGFFDQLSENRPKLLYGSRGTGKTTILKAMTLEEADDKNQYLQNRNYIGFYYKIDLNISNSFSNVNIPDVTWHKLFSYFFTCCLAAEVFQQIDNIKNIINANEKAICQEVGASFELSNVETFSELISEIKKIEKRMEIYINNIPYKQIPTIGAFSSLLQDIPAIIIKNSESSLMTGKHFVYLIDEFENLQKYQQRAVFSLVKYANHVHTYIIGSRPFGLKILSTIGDEYIRETDDITFIHLDDGQENYEEFAKKVCNKRLKLFYSKYVSDIQEIPTIDTFFNSNVGNDNIQTLFGNKDLQEKHESRVKALLNSFDISDNQIYNYLSENQEQFYFLTLKLIKERNRKRTISKEMILDEIDAFKDPDKSHKEFIQNYKYALIYYIYHLYKRNIPYSSFRTIVQLSGHTLRYLLEMCNEIFIRTYGEDNTLYEKPHLIPTKIQSDEILNVSTRRFEQIRAVDGIGPRMQQFIKAFGIIASISHEDSCLAKWESNHFSIKPDSKISEKISIFLQECVYRGILLQFEDNKIKAKNTINNDQYMYQIHPIYTPKFQISSRKKQKMEFSTEELETMVGDDIKKINRLIQRKCYKLLSNDIAIIIPYLKKEIPLIDDSDQSTIFDWMEQGE